MVIYKYKKFINLLFKSKDYLSYLSKNPAQEAVEFLIKNPDNIHWFNFSENSNPVAVEFLIKHLIKHPDKIIDKIIWSFSRNTNPVAVDFLIKNHPNKIPWNMFSVFVIFKKYI